MIFMVCKIHFLPDEMVNQIAAGEVVESPAACIKELIENSLDAGATAVNVEISKGGLDLIRISDNGTGMNPEEMKRSVQRFATSKIEKFDDLSHLSTLGFRGEALPSIASISHFSLLSSNGEVGNRLKIQGGRQTCFESYARTRGTTVEVSSLFYNVPARKKFQKSASANQQEITKLLKLFSIGYPQIEFTLRSENKVLFHTETGSFTERVEQVFSYPFSSQCLSFSYEEKGKKIYGMLGKPSNGQVRPSKQYLFLNRRFISSRLISEGIRNAYGTRMKEGEHPLFILNMDISPEEIDVNVHPQKKEVRFAAKEKLQEFLNRALSHAFRSNIPSFSPAKSFSPPPKREFIEEEEPTVFEEEAVQEEFSFQEESSVVFTYESLIGSYFLVQTPELSASEVWVIDLKAAYSRLLYERFMKGDISKQALLFPVTFDLMRGEMEKVCSWKLPGITFRQVGPDSLAVDEIPDFLSSEEFQILFPLILEEGPEVFDRQQEKKLVLFCSRFGDKNKKTFTQMEAHLMTKKLFEAEDPNYSPLGKAIRMCCDFDTWFQKRKKSG